MVEQTGQITKSAESLLRLSHELADAAGGFQLPEGSPSRR
jgi:hypothetical protein